MGADNIFIFGMTVQEVADLWARGYGCISSSALVVCICVLSLTWRKCMFYWSLG